MAFGLETGVENVVNIKVVGVGGAGCKQSSDASPVFSESYQL